MAEETLNEDRNPPTVRDEDLRDSRTRGASEKTLGRQISMDEQKASRKFPIDEQKTSGVEPETNPHQQASDSNTSS